MKIDDLLLAKCIINVDPRNSMSTRLKVGEYYVVDEVMIGQSNSSVKLKNDKSYNSIMFEYYDDYMNEVNIYEKYSPYKNIKANKNNKVLDYLNKKRQEASNLYEQHKQLSNSSYYMGYCDMIGEIVEYIEENKYV